MKRGPCVIAVIENGKTRCGMTRAYVGLGGLPYRFLRRAASEDGQAQSLFEALKLPTEISAEEYQEILDHPENADDFSALIEIDVDHNAIRTDEDMGEERECHEFPLDVFMERIQQFKGLLHKRGMKILSRKTIYGAMEKPAPGPPALKMEMEGM